MTIYQIKSTWLRRAAIVVFVPFAAAYLLTAFICVISYEIYQATRDVVVDAADTVRECAVDIRTVWRGPSA